MKRQGLEAFLQVDEVEDLGSSAGDPRLPTTVKGLTKPSSDGRDNRSGWDWFCLGKICPKHIKIIRSWLKAIKPK